MKAFEDLGASIDDAWSRAGRAPVAFPAIAAESLQRAELHRRVDIARLADWLADADAIPPQNLASTFGEPPLNVFVGQGWAIQVLCWVEGRTTVHCHDFAGAFTVMTGSSIQRRYRFTPRAEGDAGLRLGALERRDLALLDTGAVEVIEPGAGLIHSVFHLDRPTLSVVARTDALDLDGPQFDYWPPSVAIDPEYADPLVLRRTQVLAMLLRAGLPEAEAFATALVTRGGLQQAWRVLDLALGAPACAPYLPRLIEAAAARHGDAATMMLASLRQARWEHGVGERRSVTENPEHRFFLGALLCTERREDVFALVAARHPSADADALVRRWIRELLPGSDPTTLAYVAVTEALLGGDDDAAVAARLRVSHPWAERAVGDLAGVCAQVRAGTLRPLFSAPR